MRQRMLEMCYTEDRNNWVTLSPQVVTLKGTESKTSSKAMILVWSERVSGTRGVIYLELLQKQGLC